MLHALLDAIWRASALVLLGVAPYLAPLDATRALGAWSLVRVLVALAVALGVGLACVRGHKRDPWPGVAGGALVVLAFLLSATFTGERGPVARGVVPVSIAAWMLLASLATDPVARALKREGERAKVRAALGAIAVVVAGVSLLAARGRLAPRAHLWDGVLAADPGNEPAAMVVAARERDAGDAAGAFATLKACALANAHACRCAENGAAEGIDLGAYTDSKAILDASGSCDATPLRTGVLAEALVGTENAADALAIAKAALDQRPDNAHAMFARAWAIDLKGDHAGARGWAERAVALGRGAPAEMLLGSILVGQNDLEGAKRAFGAVVQRAPNDARATYDLAYIAHREGSYRDAREGYLRTLKLDPSMLEARYNLAILAHARGADGEAQHHAAEFAKAAPGDPRVATLRAALAAPP